MSLDINACLKAFSVACCQYRSHPNEQTLKYVERQMDVLIGITSNDKSLSGFTARELLPTECLTSLVSMLSEINNKPRLTSKCLLLLYSLGLLLEHSSHSSSNEGIIFQCLQLLQRVTYDCRYPLAVAHIHDLVKFLVNEIQDVECELTMPSLGTLANLCRNNIAVQAQVKALDNIKYIYRSLVKFLSHHNLTVIVYALSLITSLALKEQLGEKLFNHKNIDQTFQLLFNILINGEGILARKYSVDLFVDLLPTDKIKHFLSSYDHLAFYLNQSLDLLSRCQPDEAQKIFQFLLAFCGVSDLRSIVHRVFESSQSSNDTCEPDDAFGCVLIWVNVDTELHLVSIKALEFFKEMFEEAIANGESEYVMSRVENLLPSLIKNLEAPTNVAGHATEKKLEKIVHVLDVLAVLAREEEIAKHLHEIIPFDILLHLVEQQYRLNDIAMKDRLSFTADWSEIGVAVALKTLDLMIKIKPKDKNIRDNLGELMQDERLVSFLANTISNGQKDDIQTALRVLQESCRKTDFHIKWLGEQIFGNNRKKEEELKSLRKQQDDVNLSPLSESTFEPGSSILSKDPLKYSLKRRDRNHPKTSTFVNSMLDESTIENLIDKMKSGMEIKDTKASEIMDVYEAKLNSLQTKESHLQDLLEAKTLALAQSDRMISQYRCRRAQSEAECTKLRHMLQETEKRCEAQVEQINRFLESEKESSEQIKKLHDHVKNLQVTAGEYEQLKIAFAEQTNRSETLRETLNAAQKEHESLSELSEMLRRHNDNLKNQHDCATRQLHQLEEERKKIMQQLQLKDLKINELSETLEAQAENLQNKKSDIEKLEESFAVTKSELAKKEQARKELAHKVASLEVVCSQHEKVVKEKEQQLKDQQGHLDKYAQMSAMIHSLTSGTVSIVKNEEKAVTTSKKK
ncbi:protein CIP2A homolog isoform X2 [Dendronephthya gigantea]|uniref:protein CIP2A homolog isoform X2 n=1 Tax=Dendronephthya gigantea TaxID=151771 RepID=UPI00106B69AD|nr:protein CIP2A homolog isoform X2 [Dendronephthya gigantea]